MKTMRKSVGSHFLFCNSLAIALLFPGMMLAKSNAELKPGGMEIAQADKREVKGFVCDENGNPIIGASVVEKGTKNGVITDDEGLFTLRVPADATVNISFIGYNNREIKVNNRKFISIPLIPQSHALNDVVVVGFGKQKKESLVGAVTAVKPEDLSMTSSSLTTAFAGKIPGMIAFQRKGEPGYDNATFFIRGISTFGANTNPLILLDGVEIDMTMLNNIPPESIESFSVLKDATSTSLYGSRGANGVILINTKQGQLSEKMQVDIRFDNTFSLPTQIMKMADGPTYMKMYNEAGKNDWESGAKDNDYVPFYSQEKIDKTIANANPYVFPNNDWYHMLFRDFSQNQNLNATVKGGTKMIDYFLNAGIFLENGITKRPEAASMNVGLNSKKYLFQSNVTAHVSPTTKVTLNMNAQITQYHAPFAGSEKNPTDGSSNGTDLRGEMSLNDFFYWGMLQNPVTFPAIYPAQPGDYAVRYGSVVSPFGGGVGSHDVNPLAKLSNGYTERSYVYMTTAFSLDQDLKFITPGLRVSALASFYNYSFSWLNHWTQPYYYTLKDYKENANGGYDYTTEQIGVDGISSIQSASGQDPTQRVWALQAALDYARTFGKHNVAATFVYRMKETRLDKSGGSEKDLLPYREQGMAGRLTYNYAERYFLEATFGYNGSENFMKGHRFGFFPAVALGWTISNESFFEPLKPVVTNLKLRGSYGEVGNDALNTRFPYVTEVQLNQGASWVYGGGMTTSSGPQVSVYGNELATWEKAKKFNIGVDLTLLKDLSLTFDYFTEKRSGIFMQRRSVASYLGFSSGNYPYANIGAVDNKGFEIGLNYQKAFTKDLIVSVNGSFTYAHNEVTNYDEPDNVAPYYTHNGHPINSIRGYIAEGLFTSQEEIDNSPKQTFSNYTIGNIKYKDLNNDGIIDGNDITTIGNPEVPEIVYGFGGNVRYKKWDFTVFFQGAGKTSLLMKNNTPFADASNRGLNIPEYIVENHWSESNNVADAAYPRLTTSYATNDTQASTYYLRNASFLRLKNIELGYTVNKWLRVYVAGSNLFYFAPFRTWDPEMGSGNGLSYPLQRTAKIGIQFHY